MQTAQINRGLQSEMSTGHLVPLYFISVPLAENETMHNNMAMDMDTGDIHMISPWPNDDDEDE